MPHVADVWHPVSELGFASERVVQQAVWSDARRKLSGKDAQKVDDIVTDVIRKVQAGVWRKEKNINSLGQVGAYELLMKLGIFLCLVEKAGCDLKEINR